MAASINAWVATSDAAAPVPALRGKLYACPGPGSGDSGILNRQEICAGAVAGETRRGFSFGEELVPESTFRARLARVVAELELAPSGDAWGAPGPEVAAIGCFRLPAGSERSCDDRSLDVTVTVVGRFAGLGIPGQRTTYQVLLHREDGSLWIDGIGLSVAPLARLTSFDIAASVDGAAGTFSSRPWRP